MNQSTRPLPTSGAGLLICTRILGYVEEGEDIDETTILEAVNKAFPKQNPSAIGIAYYKTQLRNHGHDIPHGRIA